MTSGRKDGCHAWQITGEVEKGDAAMSAFSGANVRGTTIYLTGTVGDAAGGLELMLQRAGQSDGYSDKIDSAGRRARVALPVLVAAALEKRVLQSMYPTGSCGRPSANC